MWLIFVLQIGSTTANMFGPSKAHNCYWTDSTERNILDARSTCWALGGNLPSFATKEEFSYAISTGSAIAGTGSGFWVSQHDMDGDGVWRDYAGRIGTRGAFEWNADPGSNDCAAVSPLIGWRGHSVHCYHSRWLTLCEKRKELAKCGDAPDIPNMETVTDNTPSYGLALTYRCNSGYKMLGGHDGNVACNCDDTWSTLPSCEPVYCPADTILNGQLSETGQVLAGQSVQAQCNDGYALDGDVTFTCELTGAWGQKPSCQIVTCPLRNIGNGTVTNAGPLGVGDTLPVQCNEGYTTDNVTATCGSDGNYNALPTCSRIPCTKPTIDHADIGTDAVYAGDVISITCEVGYSLSAGDGFYKCDLIGTWEDLPTCKQVYCPTETISNGLLNDTGQVMAGQAVQVQCNDGYALDGDGIFICGMNGTWGPKPSCQMVTCPVPVIGNGTVARTEPLKVGETATVQCIEGYTANEVVATCGSDGNYEALASCVRIPCTMPTVEHAVIGTETSYAGDLIPILCEAGYSLSTGNGFYKCDITGTWENLPTCKHVHCPTGTISNGMLNETGQVLAGAAVRVKCNDGYALDGDGIFTCGMTGTWGPKPVCQSVTCPLPIIENGSVTNKESLVVAETLTIQCNAGYITDNRTATCGPDGTYQALGNCSKVSGRVASEERDSAAMVRGLIAAGLFVVVLIIVTAVIVRKRSRGLVSHDADLASFVYEDDVDDRISIV